jgi:hypothetical protein
LFEIVLSICRAKLANAAKTAALRAEKLQACPPGRVKRTHVESRKKSALPSEWFCCAPMKALRAAQLALSPRLLPVTDR